MFLQEKKNSLRFIDSDSDVIVRNLDNKLYELEVTTDFFGNKFYNFNVNTAYDQGKVAEAGVFKNIKEYVKDYYSEEGKEVRKVMALPSRLGLLFTGEPGTGKTFLAGQLAKFLREQENAVAISTTSPSTVDLGKIVDMARGDDPDRLVIMIWDEFEKDYQNNGRQKALNKLLAFLDGVDSRDNVMVVATCNDLSVFPGMLLDRPGRFEKVVEFKISDDNVLENLVRAMIPDVYKERISEKILIEAAGKIENISVDKIKSLIRDSLVNILKGKKDYIPVDEDRYIPKATDPKDILQKQITKRLLRDATWKGNSDDLIKVDEFLQEVDFEEVPLN